MTQDEKAEAYDSIVREADRLNRKLSVIKSGNAGISTNSPEYEEKANEIAIQLYELEEKMKGLFV